MSVMGMSRTVLRNLFSRPATRLYPGRQKEAHRTQRSRGRIEIEIDACIFCGACAKRCPTDAIIVSKPQKEWNIDRLRCCTCNACVEVCPKKCLAMGNRYTFPTVTRDKDIFRQEPTPVERPPRAS
ncbi:MAG: 4Fe-4S dicluster domain-containing protein [Spirochaetia bacterium]|jgi:formate hydrogenlyase subunit 6/NADH:ubiquinone oxidoreductase subunit I